jgi:hypothetical protein
MRTFTGIDAGARPSAVFSNGTEYEIWSANWCDQCTVGIECPIAALALLAEKTPTEWMWQPAGSPDRYHCIEFRDKDSEPSPEPQPIPDPPVLLLSREPYEDVRTGHTTCGAHR